MGGKITCVAQWQQYAKALAHTENDREKEREREGRQTDRQTDRETERRHTCSLQYREPSVYGRIYRQFTAETSSSTKGFRLLHYTADTLYGPMRFFSNYPPGGTVLHASCKKNIQLRRR